ncbi:hypothetical protein EN829_014925 [Mesorhizobium sp. M00.F.Ca.ET.186.01.1.1]|nr:hypothetical protein EN848_14510 [bacterium M00.F.Ca.ET.205.01.1.1]TGU52976.1 hypothetical protein EN795_14885 [bacterium M00.F.Ca.ET.152.01.1.1]TGV35945.1 hypothetical protein EN829_014925 [Mesorhizobium sp. M00.F.Ca.ET.186.01.1.1]TGZ43528.1 hypothetical protein EN805_10495 [bacterium M00.F.Ca.ET.162.01.1.1]
MQVGRMHFDEWRGSIDGRPSLFIKKLFRVFGCVVQLHMFIRADDPGCFHTHPAWAVRIILRGGYVEELGDGRWRAWRPGSFGIVGPDYEHRIGGLLNGKWSWSLWLRGPKIKTINARGC